MHPPRKSDPARHLPRTRRAALIERLAALPRLAELSVPAARVVLALRLVALCARTRSDPVVELARQLGSVAAARAVLELIDCAGACWPDKVQVMRPCCAVLSADETVFAGIAAAARTAQRVEFERVVAGFVRRDRHERLFDRATIALAMLG